MTDVFLINFRNDRDMYPPFGIMYVADALIQQGLQVELWHETGHGAGCVCAAGWRRSAPAVGGLQHHHRPSTLAHALRPPAGYMHLGIPTVWGGVHATIMPADVLQEDIR